MNVNKNNPNQVNPNTKKNEQSVKGLNIVLSSLLKSGFKDDSKPVINIKSLIKEYSKG
jgi:hypothetical protein